MKGAPQFGVLFISARIGVAFLFNLCYNLIVDNPTRIEEIVLIVAIIASVLGVMHLSGMLLPKRGSSARELVNETAAARWQTPAAATHAAEVRLQREAEDADLAVLDMIYWVSSSPSDSAPLIQLAQRAGMLQGHYTEEMVNCGAASLIYFINQMRIERGEIDITPEAIIGHPTLTR